MKQKVAIAIRSHPDFDEIVAKLTIGISPADINTWLSAKYANVGDKSLIISKKDLKIFHDEYLDFYNQMSEDITKVKSNDTSIDAQLQSSVYNNSTYRERLNEYIDKEIDIKTIVKNMVVAIESRAMQVFDYIQEDNRNLRSDRVLIEWLNLLVTTLEKYDAIINGSPDRILQQNNINIQIVDQHINVFHKVIREVISKLDYDTSLLFIDLFNEELKKIKDVSDQPIPIDIRLEETKQLKEITTEQLSVI